MFWSIRAGSSELTENYDLNGGDWQIIAENGRKWHCWQISEITNKMIVQMKTLYDAKETPVIEICKSFGIGRSAFYAVVLE